MKASALWLTFLLLVGWARESLLAECTGLGPKSDYVAIFEGTVREIGNDTANRGVLTIDVHWVWKGNVRSRATAYFYFGIDVQPEVRVGDRRVFFMTPLDPDDKSRPGWIVPCGGAQRPEGRIVNPLGRPWRP